MLEVFPELEKVSEGRYLLKAIMRECRGWLEEIIIADEARGGFGRAALAASGIALTVREIFSSNGFEEAEIQLRDGRYLVLRAYNGGYVIALTKPNPNLGLIRLTFRKYLSNGDGI